VNWSLTKFLFSFKVLLISFKVILNFLTTGKSDPKLSFKDKIILFLSFVYFILCLSRINNRSLLNFSIKFSLSNN